MSQNIELNFSALGTWNNIKLYNCENSTLVQDKIISRIQEIDDHMSAFKEMSDISKIVGNAGISPVKINKDTAQVIEHAIRYYKKTDGAFDITIKPLVDLWGIGKNQSYIPTDDMIFDARNKVDSSKLSIDMKISLARLNINGGAIDLGGIAKGYAADEIKRILLENEIENAIINLGGNIVTIGTRQDGSSWRVGIQNPLAPRGEYLGILSVSNKSVVTSGSYEQFFIKDKVRYHHIIDPRTGYPAQTSLLSVTAVCDKSIDADALTTSLFIMGIEKGIKLVNEIGAEVIFVTDTMEIIMTKGLQDKFDKRNKNSDRREMYAC